MRKLSKDQINEIARQVDASSIQSKELKEDLTDHICCMIEDDLQRGSGFEDSMKKAIAAVFPGGIEKSYKKNLWLITSKKQNRMKLFLYVLSYISLIIMTTSFLFKALHWPGAGVLLIVASFLFTFIFTPVLFMYIYRVTLSKYLSRKSLYVVGFTGVVILLAGATFKAFHWPGSNFLVGTGVLIICFFFLPLIFLALYRKSQQYRILKEWERKLFYFSAYFATTLFLLASFLKLLHLLGSAVLLVTSIIVLNFVFLPLLLKRYYNASFEDHSRISD